MQNSFRHALILAGVAGLLWLAGCASSVPRPSDQLSATETAIAAAAGTDARQAEPALLNSAQDKFSQARDAIDSEQYRKATWLLEEAEVEANLAKARAETAKTQRAVDEMQESIESLREGLDS